MIEDEDDEEIPWSDPEDCHECGFSACEFGDGDWSCGAWVCPDCGAVQ